MSAKKLLDLLEQNGLLDSSLVGELRKQIARKPTSAETVAKALVDKGHLTRFQATNLVGQATEKAEEKREARATIPREEDLGLAPDDDDEDPSVAGPPAAAPEEDDVVMLEVAGTEPEEVSGLTPVEDAGAGLTPVAPPPLAAGPTDAGLGQPAAELDTVDPFSAASGPAMLPTVRRAKRNVWDTKLIVGGSLALLLLLLFGGALLLNLWAVPADERWQAAMDDYRSESYSQAEAKFETFLKKFPKDDRASEARVRIALCQIRVVLSDPQKGLDRANELLPTAESEAAFTLAREELATMLIEVPEGFLKKAKLPNDIEKKEELVGLTERGKELIDNPAWVPSSQRLAIQHRIDAIEEGISLVKRDIHQERDLAAAIAGINSVTETDHLKAYQIYKDLLSKYPGLAHDQDLIDALKAVTENERRLVRVSQPAISPLTEAALGPGDYRIVLASRTGQGAGPLENQVAAVLAGGSVYGLDAASGEVLWGQFVGHGTGVHPVRTSSQSDADVLLVDGVRLELVCVSARDGKLKWRLSVGEPCSTPVVVGKRIYLSLRSGKLLEIDATSGASSRQAVTPLKLSVAAAADRNRPRIFLLGEHSNLYVISTDSLECSDVLYLGHKAGTVAVAPLVHMSHVFVAENYASNLCRLNILRIKGDSDQLTVVQEPIQLKGNVVVPLVAYGRRLLAVTDLGEVRVLDIDVNKDPPCSQAASLQSTLDQPLTAYPLTEAGSLWIADNRLSNYRIQVTTGKIARQTVVNTGDTFTGPLQLFGNLLVHTRRRKAAAGVTVAAVNIDSPRTPLWQTNLGVPAGRVTVDRQNNRIHVISAAAALFEITEQVLKSGYSDQPNLTAGAVAESMSFTEPIECGKGRVALFNPANPAQLLVYDPSRTADRLRLVSMNLSQGKVTCLPVAFQGGLLAPTDSGEVLLIDLDSGSNQLLPFRPKLAPGERVDWHRPAVVGDQFVIIDGQRNVYRVGVKDSPQPFLNQLAKAKLDVEVDSALAAAGDTLYGVVRAGGSDVVVAINFRDLKAGREWDLQGRVTWGPATVGEAVLLVTDDRHLHCFQAGQKTRWTESPQMHGRPAGPPLVDGEDYIFAADNGIVWRIAGSTGKETNKAEVGEPLGAGPVAFGSRLLLAGKSGALRVIPMPAGS